MPPASRYKLQQTTTTVTEAEPLSPLSPVSPGVAVAAAPQPAISPVSPTVSGQTFEIAAAQMAEELIASAQSAVAEQQSAEAERRTTDSAADSVLTPSPRSLASEDGVRKAVRVEVDNSTQSTDPLEQLKADVKKFASYSPERHQLHSPSSQQYYEAPIEKSFATEKRPAILDAYEMDPHQAALEASGEYEYAFMTGGNGADDAATSSGTGIEHAKSKFEPVSAYAEDGGEAAADQHLLMQAVAGGGDEYSYEFEQQAFHESASERQFDVAENTAAAQGERTASYTRHCSRVHRVETRPTTTLYCKR